jgi:hypothetical protein
MPTPDSLKMGPGTLKFDTALAQNPSLQVVACEIVPTENVETDDDVDVLTGDVLYGDETITFEWVLNFTILQAIGAASFVAWTWANAGLTKDFEFIPNTVGARKVTGTIKVVPSKIGGESKKRAQAELSFRMPRNTSPVLAATP